MNHLLYLVGRLHHVRHLDREVVVPIEVQNRRWLVTIATIFVHLHLNIIQVRHHQNDIVVRAVMLIMVDVSVPFARAMLNQQNVYSVYWIIAIMSCTSAFFSLAAIDRLFFSCYECIVSWKRSKYSNAESER